MSLHGAGLRSDRGLDVRLLRFWNRPNAEEPSMLAEDLLAAGRTGEAVRVVEAALELDPSDAEIMVTGARAWLEEGRVDRAQLLLTRAAGAEPTWCEPWRRLGELLTERGCFDRAARVLERARGLEPEDVELDAAWRRAERLHGIDARLARFRAAPRREEPVMLAKDLLRDGRVDHALEVTSLGLEVDADDAELWLARAQACAAAGDRDGEREALASATATDPGWLDAWRRRLAVLLEDEALDEAHTCVTRALEHHPSDSRLVCLRMQIEEMLDCDDEPEPMVEFEIEVEVEVAEAVEDEPEPVLEAVTIKRPPPQAPAVVAQPPVVVVGAPRPAPMVDPELEALLAELERETIVPAFRDTLPGVPAPVLDFTPNAFGIALSRRRDGLRTAPGRRPYVPPTPEELYPIRPETAVDRDSWALVG